MEVWNTLVWPVEWSLVLLERLAPEDNALAPTSLEASMVEERHQNTAQLSMSKVQGNQTSKRWPWKAKRRDRELHNRNSNPPVSQLHPGMTRIKRDSSLFMLVEAALIDVIWCVSRWYQYAERHSLDKSVKCPLEFEYYQSLRIRQASSSPRFSADSFLEPRLLLLLTVSNILRR